MRKLVSLTPSGSAIVSVFTLSSLVTALGGRSGDQGWSVVTPTKLIVFQGQLCECLEFRTGMGSPGRVPTGPGPFRTLNL